jgi:hypothetical protein
MALTSKNAAKLKAVARRYNRHPAGSGKGGQFAPKQKSSPYKSGMTLGQFQESVGASSASDFEDQVRHASAPINDKIQIQFRLGATEKESSRQKDYYTYTNKRGKEFRHDLVETSLSDGRSRILMVDSRNQFVVAGAVLSPDGKISDIHSLEPGVGLGKQILKAVGEKHGRVEMSQPISQAGAALWYSYEKAKR